MKNFAYLQPTSFADAAEALGKVSGSVAKGAGTDLMDLLKSRTVEPEAVVSLLNVGATEKRGELSAIATLHDIATDEWIRMEFPALHHAAAEAATPQIRHVGTLGGNLAQATRCWYFRTPGHDCIKKGAERCAAMDEHAENRYHAIFPSGGCAAAHASNLAPALIALKAKVDCVHPDGDRTLDAEFLYETPKRGRVADHGLRDGEIIRAVRLEPSALARRSVYMEVRERQSFDFALVGVAAAADVRDGKVHEVRIVCSGIAPTPLRLTAVEQELTGGTLNPAAARLASNGAEPLGQNGFKAVLLQRVVARAIEGLAK
jgi:xanthine dehydrogenase YagS FAD-binding subunit